MTLVILYLKEETSCQLFFFHRLCYQHFTVKSSLERIIIPNTNYSELSETKLRIINLFNNNRALVDKRNNTILKKEHKI